MTVLLIGWCHRCRRVRRVHVTTVPAKGVAVGVCTECRERKQ